MLTRRTLLTLAVFGGLSRSSSAAISRPAEERGANDTPDDVPVSVYNQLFPVPTGTNGYEDIVLAGERLRQANTSSPYDTGITLAQKRTYLADPACRDALQLLRQGLAKPIQLPREIAHVSLTTAIYPDYALLRALARLLNVHVYVGMATGKNDNAVTAVADGLHLASLVKGEATLGGLVGNAIDAIILVGAMRLRQHWTISDCDRLFSLAEYYLSLPDPALAAQRVEREEMVRYLSSLRDKPEVIATAIEEMFEPSDEEVETDAERENTRRARQQVQTLRANAELRQQVVAQLPGAINSYFDTLDAILIDPTRKMDVILDPEKEKALTETTRFVRDTFMTGAGAVRKALEARLRQQMLGVHAAICRYRWENDRLPNSLTELKLAEHWQTDPFTAQPLEYTTNGEGSDYRLASAGPLLPGEGGQKDYRQPVTFPAARPKPG